MHRVEGQGLAAREPGLSLMPGSTRPFPQPAGMPREGGGRQASRTALRVVSLAALLLLVQGCGRRASQPRVVVYTSVDQPHSEPILDQFESETGTEVAPIYDVEAAKTTGLVNRLIAERKAPKADVFWNSEFAQTILLQHEGVLAPYISPERAGIPEEYVDPDGYWTGIGTRARVIIVNTGLVPSEERPDSIFDLLDERWPGDKIGIAYPLFGTTATQAAALYATLGRQEALQYFERLRERGVQVVDGNSVVAQLVADGDLMMGLTDTDDALALANRGAEVAAILPDQGADELGTLVIPNTVALVAGGPHPEHGRAFIDFLLRASTEARLVESGWAHFALRRLDAGASDPLGTEVKGMGVPLSEIHAQMPISKADLRELFIR